MTRVAINWSNYRDPSTLKVGEYRDPGHVQELRPEGPFDGSYYAFCGKTRRVVKILYWSTTGFCLWIKRLEADSFPWPRSGGELDEMTRSNIRALLRGIDIWKEHKPVEYKVAG